MMDKNEALAELARVLLKAMDGAHSTEIIERLLARPDVVLAALGAEQVAWRRTDGVHMVLVHTGQREEF